MNHLQSSSEHPLDPLSITTQPELASGRRTVLLVEDEAFVREVTADILESVGYRVLKARNAAEAMREFRRYGKIVALLLTDVVLPGQNGRDLACDLRTFCPGLKTIFISGYPENAVSRNGLTEDGMHYLPKPFSLESLTRKVKQVMEEDAQTVSRLRRASDNGSPA